MITEEALAKLGYRKYECTPPSFPHGDFFMQKRFTDDKGIKYFVEFVHYPPIAFRNGSDWGEDWMAVLHVNEPHMTFEQHRPISIEVAEKRVEAFFEKMCCQYYETYEEQRA